MPQSVKNVLWSYNTEEIDPDTNKQIIVGQVLNFGTKEATDWLFRNYSIEEIRKIAVTIPSGQWDRKSLALWSLYLEINPESKQERVERG